MRARHPGASCARRGVRNAATAVADGLRIVVHDYSGHPFQVQLSRELARRGHDVLHLHCSGYVTGKGALCGRPDDAETFAVEEVAIGGVFEKYSPIRRLRQERAYGHALTRRVLSLRPDIVISSNNPLFSQSILIRACIRARIPFVFWQQDVYSVAMSKAAEARLPVVGPLAGKALQTMEQRMLRQSDAVVVISEDFLPIVVGDWRIAREKVHVIENWAPLDELTPRPRDNPWAREHGLVDKGVVLYAGTLGLKHDPALLLDIALARRDDANARVVVVSEGVGADWLRDRAREHGLENLIVLGFQPYERLPDVLATGDILTVILEPDAGVFSVPSKVLSYHSAARPLLAALPATNLAARIIRRSESGLVVDPADRAGFRAAADRLLADRELRERLGTNARDYALATFDVVRIGDLFETVIRGTGGYTRAALRDRVEKGAARTG